MNSREIKEVKKKIRIKKKLKEVIVGVLLGDGTLESQDKGKTYRLKIEHSLKQKDYVDWLYSHLKELSLSPPKKKVRKDRGKERISYGFSTLSLGGLRFFAHQFYDRKTGEKVVPKIIKKLLTPKALAIWFMDDGSIKSRRHKGFILHTLGFKKRDVKKLQEALKEKFGLETRIHRQKKYKKTKWRLYIPGREREKFLKIIKPYLIPQMLYKIKRKGPTSLPKR